MGIRRKAQKPKPIVKVSDTRLKKPAPTKKAIDKAQVKQKKEDQVNRVDGVPSYMFLEANEALGPPYNVIVDTNFLNAASKAKMDIVKSSMDALYAQCTIYVTDCVIAELEKLGVKYRLTLRTARDERFVRLPCRHKGTYADDCIVDRIKQHRIYIVGTLDKALKKRVRAVPGIPIMYISKKQFRIERLPEKSILQ